MYDLTQIDKMDFKELRSAVGELYDNYVKMKRLLEDTLNNIDESNLATTFRKKVDGYESMFKITAESIESKVSYQDLENNLTQYSTIKQTANEIAMSVVQNQEYTDKATTEMSSSFTMTADRISTNVVKLNKKVDGNYTKLYSSITQTAEAITSVVGKELTEYFTSNVFPPTTNNAKYDEEKLCKYNDTFYYYNKIVKEWWEYDGEVKSIFTQTADGFELSGDVKLNGNLYSNGTIEATKIYGGTGRNRYFKIVSGLGGDMGIFNKKANENSTVLSSQCAWGIYLSEAGDTVMRMYSWGQALFGYNNNQKKFYPMGTWDFSSCNVIGLPTQSTDTEIA